MQKTNLLLCMKSNGLINILNLELSAEKWKLQCLNPLQNDQKDYKWPDQG